MNKVVIVGNLTKDPDLRTIPGSTSVCNFTLAVGRRFVDQDGQRVADFIPVAVWRTQAESCAKYLRKGSSAAVSGALQTRSYEGTDGVKRYVTEVVADEVQFLSRAEITKSKDPYHSSEHPNMVETDELLPF